LAIKNDSICNSCCQKGHKVSSETREKIGNFHKDKLRSKETCEKMSISTKGRKLSTEHIEKIRKSLTGRKLSQDHIKNRSNSQKGKPYPIEARMRNSISMKGRPSWIKGKHHTEETKYKIRIGVINNSKKRNIFPYKKSYNPKACEYLNKLNEKFGWNLQHAENGGEIELYGYFVDGYDKERNIIIEYDECNHNRPNRKEKDIIRQNNLIEKINPTLFLRYDEQWDRLYDCKTHLEVNK